jgi:hypothetical protein
MDPVTETPTARSDYALLSITYGGLLATLAETTRRRQGGFELAGRDLLPLSAATFALSKLIVHEKVETWVRAPFVEERPDGKRPKGRRLRYAVGELLSCTRCVGAWSALGLVALRTQAPVQGRVVTAVLATSAANDFLHTGFTWLCSKSNSAVARADEATAEQQRAPGERPRVLSAR